MIFLLLLLCCPSDAEAFLLNDTLPVLTVPRGQHTVFNDSIVGNLLVYGTLVVHGDFKGRLEVYGDTTVNGSVGAVLLACHFNGYLKVAHGGGLVVLGSFEGEAFINGNITTTGAFHCTRMVVSNAVFRAPSVACTGPIVLSGELHVPLVHSAAGNIQLVVPLDASTIIHEIGADAGDVILRAIDPLGAPTNGLLFVGDVRGAEVTLDGPLTVERAVGRVVHVGDHSRVRLLAYSGEVKVRQLITPLAVPNLLVGKRHILPKTQIGNSSVGRIIRIHPQKESTILAGKAVH